MPFKYPCYSRLLGSLGRFDAICGYATLAVDLLSEELQQNSDPREWLAGTARSHGLVLHGADESQLHNRLAQMFIISVHAQFEEFLSHFLDEHIPAQKWGKKRDGETHLHRILKNLGLLQDKASATDLETVEYYRHVRNRFAHSEACSKKIEKLRGQLRKSLALEEESQPPKADGSLEYGDFNLFTRSVKSLASTICAAARPTDEEIAKRLVDGKYKALKKLAFNNSRYRNALQQSLLMDFGLDNHESGPIIALLIRC